ncbi:MAG: UDP-N-acetylmuramoyl-L-alanine--D-glutamate ligase [Caldicoprobacterales bacterium]|jgi:UDP-N-acetylmuramoylalanine--D-glutamate ligase|nr:UDP-N-acetylmuramoyl-L-alanine--D-glutamate ligase [Clostridiales bacterium]
MELSGKTVLVMGLARSGISAARLLYRKGARVIVHDSKNETDLSAATEELKKSIECEFHLGQDPGILLNRADMIVLSPGVPADLPFLIRASESGIEVISEVELAYRYCKAPIIAVTGTNGKTTTTALIGEILKAAGKVTHVVGNIGLPFSEKVDEIEPGDMVAAEISSFQLETTAVFRPEIALILNISPDHLDRHKTMENYIAAKYRVFGNQVRGDILILNGDDPILSRIDPPGGVHTFYFSRSRALSEGVWVEDGYIRMNLGGGIKTVCRADQLGIPGTHNLENALAAAAAAGLAGAAPEIIADTLRTFPGVEHRIEKVAVIKGITFYNDSKGTNPDSSIKAIEAMPGATVLIAGGMDKKGGFSEFTAAFGSKVKALVLLGETADKIAETARKQGFTNIHMTKSIPEAVEKAYALSSQGYSVLLSPACASWDMFRDYEERGNVFKEAVRALEKSIE